VAKVEFKTNFGFFLVFVSLILLAFIEGKNIIDALDNKTFIVGGEIHLIGFVVVTLFILIVAVFKPYKQILVSISAITLSIITAITSIYDPSFNQTKVIITLNLIASVILIVGGVIIGKGAKMNVYEKEISERGIQGYKKR